MKQTYITLNDGNKIPQLGLGVYMIEGNEKTKEACLNALKLGYRHIDTAHGYMNEEGVGEAIKESGISREEIFITSKLWISDYSDGKAAASIDKMLKRLGVEYLDLLLIHQQFGAYMDAWRAMEDAVKAGKVRSIGLSNFESNRLEEVLEQAEIKPAVLQVECHPYYQQDALKKRIESYGTKLESWYPLGHGDTALIQEPVFTELAEKYGKTNVQIILRWHIQEGSIIFPKTENTEHMKANMQIFDFELTGEEMSSIRALDKNERFYTFADEPVADQEAQMMQWVLPD
jgi:diketogulonate reductase-like aldo/keto reductase